MRHGFLLIDKPEGPTSHDIVDEVRRCLGERKIGHLGTLDPAASGLLVLAVGAKALKVIEFFKDLSKEYEAEVTFGTVSSTYDREGVMEAVDSKPGWSPPSPVELRRVIEERFIGRISQVPPAASAVKIGGERAYRKMRQGKGVNIPPRDVLITKCDVLSYDYPVLRLKVACGSGTYIRSLAHDLGQVLRCGAYLSALRRLKVGSWSVEGAAAPDAAVWTRVMPLKDVMQGFAGIELSEDQMADVSHGRDIAASLTEETIGWFQGLPVAVLVPVSEGHAHARKVL